MAYLEIEKIRFNDRLKVTIDIDDNFAAMIPPLSLQPLLENSIKHGIAPKKEGGEVKILIKSLPYGFVGITIEDNGVGMPYEMQEKLMNGDIRTFGFSGVLKRIKILKDASLSLRSEPGKGTTIKIVIPEVRYHESGFS